VPETDVQTVSQVVRRAVALCDPDGQDAIAPELQEVFEDDDRPAPGLGGSLADELRSTVRGLDPEGDSAAAAMAAAVAIFLATQPKGGDDPAHTLREAARIEWGDDPAQNVRDWLADHGTED
jgi:hypothetical protein